MAANEMGGARAPQAGVRRGIRIGVAVRLRKNGDGEAEAT
jgi:hypothetical protein